MPKSLFDRSWIWHPSWVEHTADLTISGKFVHFRKRIEIEESIKHAAIVRISADTKYRLYVNSKLVQRGPVKGDTQLWFYDELDLSPYLQTGINNIAIEVLRLFYATPFATSFVRLPSGGLYIAAQGNTASCKWLKDFDGDASWECAIETSRYVRSDAEGDDFLHIYETAVDEQVKPLEWVSAKPQKIFSAFGITPPWKLSPRMIPYSRSEQANIGAINNVNSSQSIDDWTRLFSDEDHSLTLAPGTRHYFEIEMKEHVTADISVHFQRTRTSGGLLEIKYSECYEDPPPSAYTRIKSNRRDKSKGIYGPSDRFRIQTLTSDGELHHHENETNMEIFSPFHFRTFRVMAVSITTPIDSELVIQDFKIEKINYPLDVGAHFTASTHGQIMEPEEKMWDVSIRTLRNCMHDCYEDCPFFEQLQYAMDTRSCALFTYLVSGDDRLARQAIQQLHNSFQPALGLTASRAPCSQIQIIPNFSLYWVLMVADHFEYYSDAQFIQQFVPIVHAVLDSFARRVDDEYQLVRCYDDDLGLWDFVDWTEAWKPFGEVPATRTTGFQTVANALYAYTLGRIAQMLTQIGQHATVAELIERKLSINTALQKHCFDGKVFTDGLSSLKRPEVDYSVHSQIWTVLSGAATGRVAVEILSHALGADGTRTTDPASGIPTVKFTQPSIAMSFYTMRALSTASRDLYNIHYHKFWQPWKTQLDQNVTTWVEDNVNQRSDCHAWGSSPLYEFLSEVAGVRPAAPGWFVIEFAPRVELYDEIDARVVVKGAKYSALAHVRWMRKGRETSVTLELEPISASENLDLPSDLKIRVIMPDGTQETVAASYKLSYVMHSDLVTS